MKKKARRAKKMTPKQRVLKRWPDAYSFHRLFFPFNWIILREYLIRVYGEGDSAAQAWADAEGGLK